MHAKKHAPHWLEIFASLVQLVQMSVFLASYTHTAEEKNRNLFLLYIIYILYIIKPLFNILVCR